MGGCIDTLFDIFDNERYSDSVDLCSKYSLFPPLSEWKNKILLIESSEEKASPEKYRRMIYELKKYGLLDVIGGVLVGKPADETYYDDYKKILRETVDNPSLPILGNINIGHSTPRCIIPFGVKAHVDASMQKIIFEY